MSMLMCGETTSGKTVPLRVNDDGELQIAGGGVGGGGGGADGATAANQEAALDRLDQIYDALALVGTEATSAQILAAVGGLAEGASLADLAAALAPLATQATQAQILAALAPLGDVASEATAQDILAALGPLATSLDVQSVTAAVTALGDGKTIDDVAAALAPLATEATQEDILAALEAHGVDLAVVRSDVALLVPDLDAVRVATQAAQASLAAMDSKIPALDAGRVPVSDGGGILTVDGAVGVTGPLPAGSNTIGKVDQGAPAASGWLARLVDVAGAALGVAGAPLAVRLSDGAGFVGAALDATVQAVRDRLPTTLSGSGALRVSVIDAATPALATNAAQESGGNLGTIATNTGRIPAQGQALAAGSLPVVLPLAQAAGALALDRTTAAAPPAARLSDGTSFYRALGAGENVAADLRVGGTAVGAANPVPISPGTGAIFDVSDRAARALGVVTAAAGAALALDSTLTGGSLIAIAKGPIAAGAAVGAERPVLVGGIDDALNAQRVNIDSTGAVRVQSGGIVGAVTPARAMQIAGADGANLRAPAVKNSTAIAAEYGWVVRVASNPRPSHRAASATLPAANTTHVISATPATLRRLEWRYTGGGTKYIVICDQAGGTAAANSWTGWYRPMTNGGGISWFEWPEGVACANGIVLGVSATEPTTTLTLSAAAAENFVPVFWSYLPFV